MRQRTPRPRVRRRLWRTPALGLCLLLASLARGANAVDVEVRGVSDELRDNVLAYLSFERYRKGGVELNPDTVERLQNRIEREVDAALKPFGYYAPEVQSRVTHEDNGSWRVRIDVNPGEPVRIEHIDVRVDGPGEKDPLFGRILAHLPLRTGQQLNHRAYEDIKNDLQRTAATYGYLDARLIRNELVVDPPHHQANIALELDTGERYRFGPTRIEQHVVHESLVRRYLRYREGDAFDLTQVLRTQFALDDAQYFANLEVLPGTPDREAHVVPVSIKADPARRHRYLLGPGYATDTGPRVSFGYEDRRINELGHSLSVQLQASKVNRYSLQSRYTIPIGDPAVENFSLRGTIEQRDWGDVTTRTVEVGPAVTAVTGGWQHVWAVNAVRTTSESLLGTETDRLLVPELDLASVPKGYLGEPLFEHPLFIQLKGSQAALGSNSNWVQAHLQAERVLRLGRKWHLLLRGEVGATFASQFSQLPTVFRFFAGGDNSVRGFAYNNLSPTQQTSVCATPAAGGGCTTYTYIKVGGKDLITGTVEFVRDLPRNLGVATFFDYGNAFDRFGTKLAYSVGVGLRVRLPVLTLGIDVAQPIYEPCQAPFTASNCAPHSPRLHINFSPKL
ncbi:MAG: BamA/TamA family outer membrane protein [Gammaproteobacteria bacterium]|nr:BamA/TamA family outer membrane protein [Gammaproteobacteria bacterium]